MSNPVSRRLSLRIWLTSVGAIVVLTLAVGWAWRMAEEQKASSEQPPFVPPSREMVLRDPAGREVLRGLSTRQPAEPGEAVAFHIEDGNGQIYVMQMAPRQPRPEHGGGGPGRPGGGGP
ncbi:MAG: two-component sensor histidine kinase, partial [Acidovorax sp.]